MDSTKLWLVALAVLFLNVPFGFWRAGTRKFSPAWFVAIHAPVPLVIALRLASDLGFRVSTVPVMIGAYFTGQFLGSRWRHHAAQRHSKNPGRSTQSNDRST